MMNKKLKDCRSDRKVLRKENRYLRRVLFNTGEIRPNVGVGFYHLFNDRNHKENVERIIDSGLGIVRVILLSESWYDGLMSMFPVVQGNKKDLTRLDDDFVKTYTECLNELVDNGVTPVVDLFDEVGYKSHNGRADRHPFNGKNNIHACAPIPGRPYKNGPGNQRTDFPNLIEHALKVDYGPQSKEFREILFGYIHNIENITPEGCILCTGNELESRTVEKIILKEIKHHTKMINGSYLWNNYNTPLGQGILDDTELFEARIHVRLHHAKLDNYDKIIVRSVEIDRRHPHVIVYVDSDGAGSGSERGKNGRPWLWQEAQMMMDLPREYSFISKCLDKKSTDGTLSQEDHYYMMDNFKGLLSQHKGD